MRAISSGRPISTAYGSVNGSPSATPAATIAARGAVHQRVRPHDGHAAERADANWRDGEGRERDDEPDVEDLGRETRGSSLCAGAWPTCCARSPPRRARPRTRAERLRPSWRVEQDERRPVEERLDRREVERGPQPRPARLVVAQQRRRHLAGGHVVTESARAVSPSRLRTLIEDSTNREPACRRSRVLACRTASRSYWHAPLTRRRSRMRRAYTRRQEKPQCALVILVGFAARRLVRVGGSKIADWEIEQRAIGEKGGRARARASRGSDPWFSCDHRLPRARAAKRAGPKKRIFKPPGMEDYDNY